VSVFWLIGAWTGVGSVRAWDLCLHRKVKDPQKGSTADQSIHQVKQTANAPPPPSPPNNKTPDEELCKELREIEALQGIQGLLGWDEQTMMPPGAAPARGAQKAALAGTLHEKVSPIVVEIGRSDRLIGRLVGWLVGWLID
jgi:hypothetical protein